MTLDATQMIPVGQIHPSPLNHRKIFDQKKLEDLAESIKSRGLLQPVVVRKNSKGWELVVGHRRHRAAILAGLSEIPALIRELDDEGVIEVQVIENLQREDVHPLEEAAGYQRLMAMGRHDVARIAERVGRSAKYIYDRMKLLSLTGGAQSLFLEGRISAGHAILLARLKPSDQARALDPNTRGALFENENTLFDPWKDKEESAEEKQDPWHGQKTRSVRELQAWIDKHVRFDPSADDLPDLFPETAAVLTAAKEQAEKVIPITWDNFIQPEARDDQRVYGPRSWRTADPRYDGKPCDLSVTGVIAVGPSRGDAFKVCIEKKKCKVHWAKEIREAKKWAAVAATGGSTGEERWELEQQKEKESAAMEEARLDRIRAARPAILAAVAEAVKSASDSTIGDLLFEWIDELKVCSDDAMLLPRGKTLGELVRHLAFTIVTSESDVWNIQRGNFQRAVKPLGIDVAKLLKEHAPEGKVETSAKRGAKKTDIPTVPKKRTKKKGGGA